MLQQASSPKFDEHKIVYDLKIIYTCLQVTKLDNDVASSMRGSNRMMLPKPAQPPSVFRPRTKPGDPYEDTGVSFHHARDEDLEAMQAPVPVFKEQQNTPLAGEIRVGAVPKIDLSAAITTNHATELQESRELLQHVTDEDHFTPGDGLHANAAIQRNKGADSSLQDEISLTAEPLVEKITENPAEKQQVAAQQIIDNNHVGINKLGTPIQALPPASQLDAGVLDALPLQMRRELERAYGNPQSRCSA